jgi:hypothetical protein
VICQLLLVSHRASADRDPGIPDDKHGELVELATIDEPGRERGQPVVLVNDRRDARELGSDEVDPGVHEIVHVRTAAKLRSIDSVRI